MSKPVAESMQVRSPDVVRETHKALISEAYLISYPDDLARIHEDLMDADWIAEYLPAGVEPMEPISDILYPIIHDAHLQIAHMDGAYNPDEHRLVALFSLTMYWRDTMKDILPEGSNGLRLVFENPCNPTFTYQINGPMVIFLGAGDIHDDKYNDMAVKSLLADLKAKDSSYTGHPLTEDFCPFHISIYPTDETKDTHTTKAPVFFAVVAILIFVVTAATFLVYDYTVERRQKAVMKTAVTSSALVSSLFPDVVRDRVLPWPESVSNDNPSTGKLKSFLNEGNVGGMSSAAENPHGQPKPIAELFPDTTVFFGDIVGFTAWSSVREPSSVFTLLEALFSAFDRVARRHGVFKVETIGDSYVAVCGLPEPQKKHASIVGRFAFECIEKMREITNDMDLSLGPGTGDLCLRVGLHSGSTTAGKSLRSSFVR
jgi:Adenylate and Guanylate cyclase catalytic domain